MKYNILGYIAGVYVTLYLAWSLLKASIGVAEAQRLLNTTVGGLLLIIIGVILFGILIQLGG